MTTALILASFLASGSFYAFKVDTIDGKSVELSKYKGQVILVVNVASKCGMTPQYAGLESAYTKYRTKGFTILGFPANEFGGQEPGTNAQIKEFCEATYKVDFPMFSKIVVKGEGIHPLYSWLLQQTENKTDIEWNFAKFLIGRDGRVIARYGSKTKPDDATLVAAIETALAQK